MLTISVHHFPDRCLNVVYFLGCPCFTFTPIRREKTLETCFSCIIHHVAHQDSVQFSHCHEVTRWTLSNLSALQGKLLYIQRGIFPINVLTVPLWVMLTLSFLQLPKYDFYMNHVKTHWGLCGQTLKSILNRTGSQLREPKIGVIGNQLEVGQGGLTSPSVRGVLERKWGRVRLSQDLWKEDGLNFATARCWRKWLLWQAVQQRPSLLVIP